MKEEAVVKSIRVLPNTLTDIENLKDKMCALSFSDTVKKAIDIACLLVRSVEKGDRLLIEDKKGKQTQIILHGVCR